MGRRTLVASGLLIGLIGLSVIIFVLPTSSQPPERGGRKTSDPRRNDPDVPPHSPPQAAPARGPLWLEGKVVDAGGRAVPDAEIEWYKETQPGTRRSVTTSRSGRFRIAPDDQERHVLLARKSGVGIAHAKSSPNDANMLLTLRAESHVVGHVLLPDGTRATGGHVYAPEFQLTARIGTDGTFSLPTLPTGWIRLTATSFAASPHRSVEGPIEYRGETRFAATPRECRVTIRLTEPRLSRISVRCTTTTRLPRSGLPIEVDSSTVSDVAPATDVGGRWTALTSDYAGTLHRVTVRLDDSSVRFHVLSRKLDDEAPDTLAVPRPYRIRFTCVDSAGTPIVPRGPVELRVGSHTRRERLFYWNTFDQPPSGSCVAVIPVVSAQEELWYELSGDHYPTVTKSNWLPRDGEERITLTEGFSLQGLVLEPDRSPARGARVRAAAFSRCSGTSRLAFDGLPPGDHLDAMVRTSTGWARLPLRTAPGERLDVGTVTTLKRPLIRGRATSSDGAPLEGALVYVNKALCRTNADGTFACLADHDGAHFIEARKWGHASAVLHGGARSLHELSLAPEGVVRVAPHTHAYATLHVLHGSHEVHFGLRYAPEFGETVLVGVPEGLLTIELRDYCEQPVARTHVTCRPGATTLARLP